MQDRFLFRGKRLDNGEWVEGHYDFIPKNCWCKYDRNLIRYTRANVTDSGEIGLSMEADNVNPATIGQCTGLKDKNGNLIFEGDILHVELHNSVSRGAIASGTAPVVWGGMYNNERPSGFGLIWGIRKDFSRFDGFTNECVFEIIDNIHDNPELAGEIVKIKHPAIELVANVNAPKQYEQMELSITNRPPG